MLKIPIVESLRLITQGPEGNRDIWVIKPDGTGLRRVTNTPENEDYPAWSPDSRWIAFVSTRWRDKGDIWVVRADKPEDVIHLRTRSESAGAPPWSPDGKKICFLGYISVVMTLTFI